MSISPKTTSYHSYSTEMEGPGATAGLDTPHVSGVLGGPQLCIYK